jgi:hypothetical protein
MQVVTTWDGEAEAGADTFAGPTVTARLVTRNNLAASKVKPLLAGQSTVSFINSDAKVRPGKPWCGSSLWNQKLNSPIGRDVHHT